MKSALVRLLQKPSLIVLVLLSITLFNYRIGTIHDLEIAWDIFGYYLPLPATFVYDDPMLHETEWVKELNEERHFACTLYMIARTKEGAPMYFFLFGMALFYLTFFLLAHVLAHLFGWQLMASAWCTNTPSL